jgi:hypothetical protein
MGEARRRGTFEERKALAIKRDEALEKSYLERGLVASAKSKTVPDRRAQQGVYLAHFLGEALGGRGVRGFR